MAALTRQAPRRSDAGVIGRRETVRTEGAETRVLVTRGQRRVEVALVLAIGVAFTGIVGAALIETRTMYAGCWGSPVERTKLELSQLLHESLPMWAVEHPDQRCPVWIGELEPFRHSRHVKDPWGHPIELYCGVAVSSGRAAIWARSAGPDGELATDDDIVAD